MGMVKVDDSFFESFKNDYVDFEKWFNRKCDEEAYVCEIKNQIVGFLYLKVEDARENYSDIFPVLKPQKRMKIGTFKVESTGFRLGERFLKIVFDNAKEQNVDEIYVTIKEDNLSLQRLRALLERWGFEFYGKKQSKSGNEDVLVKNLKEYNHQKSPKFNFPKLLTNSNKYILPIFPRYHTTLFPDAILKNENMELFTDNIAHRYALQKIYVSAAPVKNVHPGDIILIYRVGESSPKKYSSVLSTIAIIDEIVIPNTMEQYFQECQNRSVFSKNELSSLWPKYNVVLKLLFYKPLVRRVNLDQLYDLGVISFPEGPRPFHQLTNNQFYSILNLSNTEL
jgi:hypothetical protein